MLAQRLKASRRELTGLWLDRISNRVALNPNKVFPTDDLLNHVPLLIDGVAEYIQNPAAEIGADMPVVAKAMELGALRHKQGFDAYQILKEYEFLGGILFTFFTKAVAEIDQPCEQSGADGVRITALPRDHDHPAGDDDALSGARRQGGRRA